jgi:hypothetical protein
MVAPRIDPIRGYGVHRSDLNMKNNESLATGIACLFFVIFWQLDPTTTTRVIEYAPNCDSQAPGVCVNGTKVRSALRFIVNTRTRDVAWFVDQNGGDYYISGGLYRGCVVVDDDNWRCGDEKSQTVGLFDGDYHRQDRGLGGYDVQGFTGLSYWWRRAFMALHRYWPS